MKLTMLSWKLIYIEASRIFVTNILKPTHRLEIWIQCRFFSIEIKNI